MSTTPLDSNNADGSFSGMFKLETPADKAARLKREKEEEKKAKEEQEKTEKVKTDSSKKEAPQDQDKLITAFQSFFSKSHPLIGKLYSGPKDGKMNPELKAAVSLAEAKIGSEIGSSVSGMILATSPADVGSALAVIVKHKEGKEEKKSSYLPRDERILAFRRLSKNN